MLQFGEYRARLNDLRPELDGLDQVLGLETTIRKVETLESESASDDFWGNLEKAQKVQQRIKQLRDKIGDQQKHETQWGDLITLCELGNEAKDETLVPEVGKGSARLRAEIEEVKLSTLLTGEYDGPNTVLIFHTDADGAGVQDWAQMLFRMYTRWAERRGYVCRTLDYLNGGETGLESVTISIEDENAYDHLKSEHGVHRLVRVSPSDVNARRQTSFAALEIMSGVPDDVEMGIRPEDVGIQVFRSSGAGGQRISKASPAVRLIHKPTGIVVSCQTEHSQFQNRDICMRMLRSKLVELQMQAHAEKISDIKGVQLKIEQDNQIRSYVSIPCQLAKDNRTGYETSNINAVMDGELDSFINAYLKAKTTGNWAEK